MIPQQALEKPSHFPASVSIFKASKRREVQMVNLLSGETVPGPDSEPPTHFP